MGLLFGFAPMVSASIGMLTDKITFTVTPKSKSSSFNQDNESIFKTEEIEENNLIEETKKTSILSEFAQN